MEPKNKTMRPQVAQSEQHHTNMKGWIHKVDLTKWVNVEPNTNMRHFRWSSKEKL